METLLGRGPNIADTSGSIGYVYSFSLGIQKQLPWQTAIEAAYVGSRTFDLPTTKAGPDAVTFVYPASTHWGAWPWSPPQEQALLYLAAAAAQGRELVPTELAFDPADANLLARLEALRQRNNVVVLFVDAANLDLQGLGDRIRDYDRPEYSAFAVVALVNGPATPALRARIEGLFANAARRPAPYFYIIDTPGPFNAERRESFSKAVAAALAQLRIGIVNHPNAQPVTATPTAYPSLPSVHNAG